MPNQKMRLTPALVASVPPFTGQSGRLAGRTDLPELADYDPVLDLLLADAPSNGDVWMFAYGSLIWNPDFDIVEERLGTVSGWRRSFCLGWVRIYRGTPESPGIMLALDRGGSCKGVVFRLPPEAQRENLLKVLRREMPLKWERISARWMTVQTDQGAVRAIGFPISRSSANYLPGLTTEAVVNALATATGERGSMAEYLYNTVTHLAERGIHDRYLWKMQDLVARQIESINAGDPDERN
ncbi:MAG: gamma-glutamylcyclotransferase [Rhodobacterales bacterium]